MTSSDSWVPAATLGAVAGLRSMLPPALVSHAAASGAIVLTEPRLQWLSTNAASTTFAALAAGEIVADKTPWIPSRIDPPPLAGRVLSGAFCGLVISSARKQPIVTGAIVGGVSALVAAFLGYELRKSAVRKLGIPDFPVALVEDVVAVSAGRSALAHLAE